MVFEIKSSKNASGVNSAIKSNVAAGNTKKQSGSVFSKDKHDEEEENCIISDLKDGGTQKTLYNDSDEIIQEIKFDKDKHIIEVVDYEYGINKDKQTYKDGNNNIKYTTEYSYDDNHHIIKVIKKDAKGNTQETRNCAYNKLGESIKDISVDGEGKIIENYEVIKDKDGNETTITEKANEYKEVDIKYANGNEKVTNTKPDGKVREYYFESGKEVKEIKKDAQNNVTEIIEYKDDNLEIYKNPKGEITKTVEYTYDSYGRATKILTKDPDGKIVNCENNKY